MNARERMLAAIDLKPVDRVPTDIWATPEVMQKLRDHFGSDAAAREALHIDGFAGLPVPYVGPAVPAAPEGGSTNFWGMQFRPVNYGTGTYSEQCHWPLADARTIDDLERYAWPRVEWFDYSGIRAAAEAVHDGQAVQCGYMAPFYYHNLLRGLELSLTDPYDDEAFAHHLIGRIAGFFYDHHRRIFEAADGLIDVAQVTDDLGSQTGPLIGLGAFRTFYKPHMQRLINLCREFGIKVFHHDDGAMREFLPDLVEMGIDILNPVQWTCPGMELEGLKRDFGRDICFHGGIDNQRILPFGTPEEVRAEVRHNIDVLSADGTGYILAPCHCIQPVTPIENIIAMYDEAWRYGVVKGK